MWKVIFVIIALTFFFISTKFLVLPIQNCIFATIGKNKKMYLYYFAVNLMHWLAFCKITDVLAYLIFK